MKKTTTFKKLRYAAKQTAEHIDQFSWELTTWQVIILLIGAPITGLLLLIYIIRAFCSWYRRATRLRERNYKQYLLEVL